MAGASATLKTPGTGGRRAPSEASTPAQTQPRAEPGAPGEVVDDKAVGAQAAAVIPRLSTWMSFDPRDASVLTKAER